MFLQYEVEIGPQGGEVHVCAVRAVDNDRSFVRLDDAKQGQEERGFPAAGSSHHADFLPGGDPEAELSEDIPVLFFVAHAHLPELDLSCREWVKLAH